MPYIVYSSEYNITFPSVFSTLSDWWSSWGRLCSSQSLYDTSDVCECALSSSWRCSACCAFSCRSLTGFWISWRTCSLCQSTGFLSLRLFECTFTAQKLRAWISQTLQGVHEYWAIFPLFLCCWIWTGECSSQRFLVGSCSNFIYALHIQKSFN